MEKNYRVCKVDEDISFAGSKDIPDVCDGKSESVFVEGCGEKREMGYKGDSIYNKQENK